MTVVPAPGIIEGMRHSLRFSVWFWIVSIVGLASVPASATLLFRTSAMYLSSNINGDEGNRLLVDVNPAYVRDKGWTFGATYQRDGLRAGGAPVTTTSLGPSVGLITRREFGFFGMATYFVSSSRDDGRVGTGYQADLGYRFQLRHLSYAMQFSYKKFSYKAAEAAAGRLEVSRIDPYFGVWYEF
jgi:hypothetical protein